MRCTRRSEEDRLAGRVRALLTLAFTSDSEHEAAAAFLRARSLNRRLQALPPEEVTEVRVQRAQIELDGELAREAPRQRRLACGSSSPVAEGDDWSARPSFARAPTEPAKQHLLAEHRATDPGPGLAQGYNVHSELD